MSKQQQQRPTATTAAITTWLPTVILTTRIYHSTTTTTCHPRIAVFDNTNDNMDSTGYHCHNTTSSSTPFDLLEL
jgi:hypothetical protein